MCAVRFEIPRLLAIFADKNFIIFSQLFFIFKLFLNFNIMKATFKPVIYSAIITLSAFLAVIYTSCKQDKCKAISCAYGGACVDGVCHCLAGYEGLSCETISRDKFVGLYNVQEQGSISPLRQYPIAIENDPLDVTKVQIKNLYNFFNTTPVTGVVNGDTLTIPNQQLLGKVVFGTGYVHYTKQYSSGPVTAVSMRYEVVDSASGNRIVDDFGYYSDLDTSKPSNWTKY